MIDYNDLKDALNILSRARVNLSLQHYIEIWGEHIGNHIWRQEGSDLIRIWRSGLSKEQSDKFIEYLIDKVQKESL